MRLTLEAAIINGDDSFDPRAFHGLSKRLVPGEAQTIGYGGDKVLVASKAARRQISTASRQAGGDLYEVIDGRHSFEGVEILLVEEDAEGNAVLGYDEAACSTSLYCCVLGDAAVTWTPETEPVLMRASLPARLGQEKPHETQAPHTRADHPQAAHR